MLLDDGICTGRVVDFEKLNTVLFWEHGMNDKPALFEYREVLGEDRMQIQVHDNGKWRMATPEEEEQVRKHKAEVPKDDECQLR